MTLEEINKIKNRIEEINRQYERNKGQIEQLMKQLKDFGCDSLEDAEERLKKMTIKGKKMSEELDNLGEEIEKEWEENEARIA